MIKMIGRGAVTITTSKQEYRPVDGILTIPIELERQALAAGYRRLTVADEPVGASVEETPPQPIASDGGHSPDAPEPAADVPLTADEVIAAMRLPGAIDAFGSDPRLCEVCGDEVKDPAAAVAHVQATGHITGFRPKPAIALAPEPAVEVPAGTPEPGAVVIALPDDHPQVAATADANARTDQAAEVAQEAIAAAPAPDVPEPAASSEAAGSGA